MKIIIDTDLLTDNVTSCSADSEDAQFPASNMRDNFTTNLYKAASGLTALITLQVSKGSAVELLNTNATAVVVTAGSGETFTLESGYSLETGYSLAEDAVAAIPVYSLPGAHGRLWAEYSAFSGPHVVKLALTAADVPSAGIIRAGVVQVFKDPEPSNGETSIDYSIEKELNNGADYFRKRNVVNVFDNLQMIETRENAFLFKRAIFDAVGPQPLAIRLVYNKYITDEEFVIFGKRVNPPHLEHLTRTKTRITFSLREVI